MNITVYLGANPGRDPDYLAYAEELGRRIGQAGNTLVYGGANDGLMGRLAESVLNSGGTVIGVIPKMFLHRAYQKAGTQYITEDMSERKQKMIELADAFIAMPGGFGTMEEFSEVVSALRIGLFDKPCVLFSPNGYYDDLKHLYEKMVADGFLEPENYRKVQFAGTITEVMEKIGCADLVK